MTPRPRTHPPPSPPFDLTPSARHGSTCTMSTHFPWTGSRREEERQTNTTIIHPPPSLNTHTHTHTATATIIRHTEHQGWSVDFQHGMEQMVLLDSDRHHCAWVFGWNHVFLFFFLEQCVLFGFWFWFSFATKVIFEFWHYLDRPTVSHGEWTFHPHLVSSPSDSCILLSLPVHGCRPIPVPFYMHPLCC